MPAFEQVARKMIAEFRVDFARCAGDPEFEALIAELRDEVPTFERLWNDVELWDSPRGAVVQHEELGVLYFDRISYVPEHHPSTRILMFIPGDPNTARTVASLLSPIEDDPRVPWNATALTRLVFAPELAAPLNWRLAYLQISPTSGTTRMKL